MNLIVLFRFLVRKKRWNLVAIPCTSISYLSSLCSEHRVRCIQHSCSHQKAQRPARSCGFRFSVLLFLVLCLLGTILEETQWISVWNAHAQLHQSYYMASFRHHWRHLDTYWHPALSFKWHTRLVKAVGFPARFVYSPSKIFLKPFCIYEEDRPFFCYLAVPSEIPKWSVQ